MNRLQTLVSALALALPLVALAASGGPEDGYCGDPPNRQTCVACHNSFALNSGQGRLQLQNLPQAYEPGQTYRVTISLSDPNARRWGFEVSTRSGNNQRGGTIAVVDANRTQRSDGGGQNPQFIKHRSAGTFAGQANSASWAFDWTAPAAGVGQVTFYLAGNAANNNGSTSGDRIYALSSSINPVVHHAPVITQPTDQPTFNAPIDADSALALAFTATDQDNDSLVWSILAAGGLPQGYQFTDNQNGTAAFAWTPTVADTGVYTPQFQVSDGALTDTIAVMITVTAAPSDFTMRIINGWSLLSCPIPPAETNIVNLWRPVRDRGHLVMVKDQNGRFYIAANNFSNLQPWDFRRGYMVRGSAVDSLTITGQPAAEDTPIPLVNGWSMVAYLPHAQQAVRDAFVNLGDTLVMVKDGSGHFYIKASNFSNLPALRQGQGYMVRTTQVANFVWNIPRQNDALEDVPETPLAHFVAPRPTGANMSLLLSAECRVQSAEYEVGVFTKDGLCVGASAFQIPNSKVQIGLAVWGDDPTTPEVDGAVEGEEIGLRIWDRTDETPVLLRSLSMEFPNSRGDVIGGAAGRAGTPILLEDRQAGRLSYATDGFATATLDVGAQGLAHLPEAFSLSEAYPNPFNGVTRINFGLPIEGVVKVTVCDLAGRTVATLVDGNVTAGYHSIEWNAAGAPSGLYLVKMQTERFNSYRKVVLAR